MKTNIQCKLNNRGNLDFYVNQDNKNYYLFTQNYKKEVYDYFADNPFLDNVLRRKKVSNRNSKVMKTIDKIPMFIKYIEKLEHINIFNELNNKRENNYRRKDQIKFNKVCALYE